MLGGIPARVMFSPGHTLASITYVIGDAAFVHDTLFMPDSGTARADFPGGSAEALWQSIQAILALPDQTRILTGHDYGQGGREPRWESTVAEQKRDNPHVAGQDQASCKDARDNEKCSEFHGLFQWVGEFWGRQCEAVRTWRSLEGPIKSD